MTAAAPPELLPWHATVANRLGEALVQDRFPHALLLCGAPGVGKRLLAEWLTALLLCEQVTGESSAAPCGRCRGCTLFQAGTHPDLRRAGLEDDSKQLRIGTIREVIRFTLLSSQRGNRRVVVVSPADKLNRNAANTLLKTLEEPPRGAHLILVADQPAVLPQTIRSRCQQVTIATPDREDAVRWLADNSQGGDGELLLTLCANAPLRARELAEQNGNAAFRELVQFLAGITTGSLDPVAAAQAWPKDRMPLLLDLLTTSTQLLIRRAALGHPGGAPAELALIPAELKATALHGYLDYLYGNQRLRDRALQPQLYLEDLFIRWQSASQARPS